MRRFGNRRCTDASVLTGVYVGRAMVVIPSLDEGLIKQSREGMVTRKGNPASSAAELFAIRTALDDFVVYSDCASEVDRVGDKWVEWRPHREMYLPNEFFDKVLHRAAYLRRSKNDVRNRRELQPYQQEQYELFNSTYCRFKLTDSALWQRVIADAATHPSHHRTNLTRRRVRTAIRICRTVARCADRSARSRLEGWVSLWLARSRLLSSQLPHCVCVERH